jgi:catalase
MKVPSRNWQEMVAPDEEQRFTHYAEQLTNIQKEKNREFGQGRALHRKQLIGLAAQLEVLPQLPSHAVHGLFAKPGVHQALVRISNGSMNIQNDKVPDIRGFAIKVLGIQGPGALGGTTDAQDFLLINREVFGLKNSDAFVKLVLAASQGGGALIKHFFKEHGLLEGFRQLASSMKSLKRPFTGYATERFFSAAPLACGPYAVRVRLLPPEGQRINPAASEDWAQDLTQRLAQGPLCYALQLQFFSSEERTPIEDGSRNWDEKDAPYITVAHLTLQAPEPSSSESLQKRIDEARFDPWCALMEHRPLGDVMRARKFAYFASQKNRK